eukprot:7648710-Alexandrium_andersonii.AAC.1
MWGTKGVTKWVRMFPTLAKQSCRNVGFRPLPTRISQHCHERRRAMVSQSGPLADRPADRD